MLFPNGPKIPLWLQKMQMVFRPIEFLDECAQRYGDTFTLKCRDIGEIGDNFPVVYFSHPQAVKEIFTADPSLFDFGTANREVEPLVGKYSIWRLNDARHQRERHLLMPPFHRKRMQEYSQLICEITEEVSSQWPVGEAFRVHPYMLDTSMRIILRVIFGLERGERFDQLKQLFYSWLGLAASPLATIALLFPPLQNLSSWGTWGRFTQLRQQIEQFLAQEIQERRQQMDASRIDVLTMLLMARDEAGQPMTDEELCSELITFLMAGHETVASGLSWALYWVHYLPEVRTKLLNEIDKQGSDAHPGVVAQIPYLGAVCQETLRMSSVTLEPFARLLKAPLSVMGNQFEPGTALVASAHLTHHREDLYQEPERFKPERFLERQFSLYEYYPFGGGNRMCIARALAELEMKLVLATILSRLDLDLADKRLLKPERGFISMAPPAGFRMIVKGRR